MKLDYRNLLWMTENVKNKLKERNQLVKPISSMVKMTPV